MSPGKRSATSTAIAKDGTTGRFSGRGAEGQLHADERHQQQHHDRQIEPDRPYGELRDEPSKQLHRRISDRHDHLKDDHGQSLGLPIAGERPNELDDDPCDQQQLEHEQRETQDLEEERQLKPTSLRADV